MSVQAATPLHAVPPSSSSSSSVDLFDVLPDLRAAIRPADLDLARRALRVPAATVAAGSSVTAALAGGSRPFAAVVAEGVVIRKSHLRDRAAAEVLCAGDLIDLSPEDHDATVPIRTTHVAHHEVRIAALDDRFRLAARRWPALHDALNAQLARQARRASRHLALLQLARVTDRIVAMFAELGDLCGRATTDGIVVDLVLTHDLLGQIVGSRRPTVSLALAELRADGVLQRTTDGGWRLARDVVRPPPTGGQ